MGLTFLNLAFLIGVAAAAVPILIHLFSRRRSRRQEWASIRFLKELYSQRVRRVKLRQMLLLATRFLAILFFALAMMRPALTGSFLASGRAPSTVCVVVDTSYSMHAARQGRATFEFARERALEVIDLLGQGDEVYLIASSDRAESATPYPMQDLGQVREQIRALEPTQRGGNLRAGVDMAARLLRASKHLNKEIYVVTDMQRVAWQAMVDSTNARMDLPGDVAVCVVAAGDGAVPNNVAVREVRALRHLAGSSGMQLQLTLTNYSDQDLVSLPVDVEIDGDPVAETFVDVASRATVRTHVDIAESDWSNGWGRVRIPEDALSADDERHFVLGEEDRVRIGVLADAEPSSQRAATFLRLALEPEPGAGPFAVRALESDALGRSELSGLHVVVVAGLERLDHASTELLKTFVRDGGSMLIFPGERSDLRYYNDRLLSMLEVKIASVVEAEDQVFRLTPQVPGHPVFRGFRSSTTERLTRARFDKVVKIVSGDARVLAQFRGDLPALVEGERVLLFASSVDRAWNDFPTSGAFLPLLHQSVAYLAGGIGTGPQNLVGARIERLLPKPDVLPRTRGTSPSGEPVAHEAIERGSQLLVRLPETREAGVYSVSTDTGETLLGVAVNLDPAEGDLSTIDGNAVASLFGDQSFTYVAGTGDVEADLRQARFGRELWRLVLFFGLLALLAEVFLSRGKGSFTPAAS